MEGYSAAEHLRRKLVLCTWTCGRCFGLLDMFILRSPTAMAPDETMTTLWPSLRSLIAVSTIRERMERMGWWVFSSTMELDPFVVISYDKDQ
jgi:hypothetical protein